MPYWWAFLILLVVAPSAGAFGQPEAVARTERARAAADTPRGAWAHGSQGDYVLRSEAAHVVIGGFPTEADADTVAPFRFGALLDIVPNLRHPDGFGYLMPTVAGALGAVELDEPAIQFSSGSDGSAWITVVRQAAGHGKATSEFRLEATSPGVLIESRLEGDLAADGVIEDQISWGEYGLFVPGVGFGMPEVASVQGAEFLLGERDGDTILLLPESGTLSVWRDGAVTRVRYDDAGTGDSVRRWLLIDEDASDVLTWFMESRRDSQRAQLSGSVREWQSHTDSGASWARGAGNAPMLLAIPEGSDAARPFLPFRTKANGRFAVGVPPGEYLLLPDPSRIDIRPASIRMELSAGGNARELEFNVAAHPTVSFTIVDADTSRPIAARIDLTGVDGTSTPRLGRAGTTRHGGTILSANGRESVQVPSGTYDLHVTRGIEYHPWHQRLVVEQGRLDEVEVRLTRAFDTPGWLAGDIASRTNADAFSPTDLSVRIGSAAAEGLDWVMPGNPSPMEYVGNFAVLPSVLRSDSTFGPILSQRLTNDDELRIWIPGENEWARFGGESLDVGMLEGFRAGGVQGLAVWDASLPEAFGSRFQGLQTLREDGVEMLPLGVGNVHGTVTEQPGYPRVYSRAKSADEVAAALMAGHYQVTNGPFLDVRINGSAVDGPIVSRDGVLNFDLRIHAIDAVSVARLTVLVNGRLARQLFFNESLREAGSGLAVPVPTDADAGRFRITIAEDSVIDLVLEGEDERSNPLVSPRGSPFAQTNAARGTISRAFHAPIHVRMARDEVEAP